MSDELFVPENFAVPDGLVAGAFRLARRQGTLLPLVSSILTSMVGAAAAVS